MTETMDRTLDHLRSLSSLPIRSTYNPLAPMGIQSDADVVEAGRLIQPLVRDAQAAAVIIACFSDPGLQEARAARPDIPVIGIAEAAYYAALQQGARFGVVSLAQPSVIRHTRHIEALGLRGRLAADRAVEMTVAEASSPDGAIAAVLEVGRQLRQQDGADVVILGCAGMGVHRLRLQAALGCPVIDPVQAALAAAMTAVALGYKDF